MRMKKYKLGEIGEIRMCKRILKHETNDTAGIPFFKIGTFGGKADSFIDKEKYDNYKKRFPFPKKGDILLSAAGTIGKAVKYSGEDAYYQDSNIVWLEHDESIILNKYLYYIYQSINWNVSKGSTILRLYNDDIRNTEVFIPDLLHQEKVADLLSLIDQKVTINRSINHNLEAMAKQLYDYWFVQFDFPDEHGRPYKRNGGKMVWNEKLKREVPALWEAKLVDDVAEVFNGATPSTADELNYGGNIVWITPKDLSDQKHKFVYHGERNISQMGYDSCSTHLLPINTILMSSRAPIGLLSIAKTELCTNQGFKSFVPKEDSMAAYLYYYLQIHIKQIEQLGTGTTFKEVSREDVLKFSILKPSNETLDLWEEYVTKINDRQLELQKENENLTKLRDELMPLLMNGQVSVNYDLVHQTSLSFLKSISLDNSIIFICCWTLRTLIKDLVLVLNKVCR